MYEVHAKYPSLLDDDLAVLFPLCESVQISVLLCLGIEHHGSFSPKDDTSIPRERSKVDLIKVLAYIFSTIPLAGTFALRNINWKRTLWPHSIELPIGRYDRNLINRPHEISELLPLPHGGLSTTLHLR